MNTAHKAVLATLATAVLSVGFFAVYALALYTTDTAPAAYAEQICRVGLCGTEGGQLWVRVDGSQSNLCNGFNYAPVSDPMEAEWRSTDVGGISVIDNCFLAGPGVQTSLPIYPPPPPPPTGCVMTLTKTPNVTSTSAGGLVEFTISLKNIGNSKCTGSGVWLQDQLSANVTYVSETHSPNITGGYDASLPTLNTDTEPHVELNPYKAAQRLLEWNAYVLDPGESAWAKVVVAAPLYPSCGYQITNKARVTSLQYSNFTRWVESNIVTVDVPCTPVPPPPTTPACTLTATPSSVTNGNAALLAWTSTGVTTCTGVNFSTGGATQNQSGVSTGPLSNTTTYTMNCSTAAPSPAGTWQLVHEDYTDYWCEAGGITDPNRNGLNKAYSFMPNCSSANPEGTACSTDGGKCKVNSGQCVIHTAIYQCGGASSSYPNSTTPAQQSVQCSTTVTVNTPPPSGPTCDLNLTKDNINWSTTGGNQVLISPLTNSPQIPGLTGGTPISVAHAEGDAYSTFVFNDITQHGGTTLPGSGIGFAADQTTMNRVCAVLHGTGSTASTFGARSYNSPGDNSVVRYNGTSWTTISARSFNSHLSSSFTCTASGGLQSYPFNGSHSFIPPLGIGTHTYRLTVNGPNGSTQCTKTVVVPPPPTNVGCKLEITKSVDNDEASPGDIIEYTINFRNVGDRDCTGGGVQVVDVVDPGLTYTDEEHSANVEEGYGSFGDYTASDRTLRWNADTLTPGESGWVRWDARANTPSACIVTIPNIAKITSAEYNNFRTWVSSNRVDVEVDKNCPPPPTSFRVKATKIVCDNEADLPNWGLGGPDITATTANGFLAGHPSCRAVPNWSFEWANANVSNPGDENASGGSSWHAFGPTDSDGVATTDIPTNSCSSADKIWVREQFKNGYIPFSGIGSNPSSVSAEMYCSIDVLNYDNYDAVKNPLSGQTYYCVAWNVSNTPTDVCPNIDGVQTSVPAGKQLVNGQCVDIPEDVCPNIDGTQTSVPAGYQLVNGQCVLIPPTPSCTLSVSSSSISTGQSVKISWTSANVTAGSIDHNGGAANPVSAGTSVDIFPPDDTTFTGTFTGPNGNATCTVFVDVRTGGGGCVAGTCPGGLNQPTVTLASAKTPNQAPLAGFVYLSQVPYTGFEAGAALTMIFWTAIALLSALIAYFIVGQGGIRYLLAYISDLAGVPSLKAIEEREEAQGTETREDVYGVAYPEFEAADRSGTQYLESVSAPVMTAPVRMPAAVIPAPMPALVAEPVQSPVKESGIPSLTGVIESRAHAAGVLVSPEAVAAAAKLSPDRAEALVIFGDILNKAIQTIPRDDGWVMLTSDRFETVRDTVMAKRKSDGIKAPAAFNVEPIEAGAPLATATDSAASEFVGAILSKDRDTAFAIVRSLEKDHISPTSLMTGTAAVLDRVYRLRKGGKNGLDAVLLEKSGKVSDDVIAKLVEIFAHSLDQAYANQFTGVKLALAQAFEIVE